jgi:hypothetical protein
MSGFLAALVRRLARIGGALRPTFGPEAGDRPCPECNHPMRDDGIDRAGDRSTGSRPADARPARL